MDKPAHRRIGIVGLGAIGSPVACHLAASGHDVTGYDRDPARAAMLAADGVSAADGLAGLAGSDIVLVLVATPAQLGRVIGEIAMLPDTGMPAYVVVSSSVAPADMQAAARALAGRPVRIVDAPVSGGVVAARSGKLTFLVGGETQDVSALTPLFMPLARAVHHCGPLGSGQAVKSINNLIAVTNLFISAEAFALALDAGLDLGQIRPALEAGSARNFLTDPASDPAAVFAAWSDDPEDFHAVNAINSKDFALAIDLAAPGSTLPTVAAMRGVIAQAGDETLANWRRAAASFKKEKL
ncbi:NAD(P)-dependent oxidoreductase [Sphingobium fuliginis]|uniref:NAD(P)-dependent oxidoreductase n=1 Tax=Sphingobium fuliginis ATCC 27551 TaxID=1208342 RepID=A0A5B8CJ16_SPHSA|nr:NAD(P)-dependent oxidoreductase [Sphingobium fuliginis]QDC39664.1 NAD(P)-dependent oxidoreductase [Sphingobium fuliginis ATCC 27551]